jgi:hypothetical protein
MPLAKYQPLAEDDHVLMELLMMNEWKPKLSDEVLTGIDAAKRAQVDLEQIDRAISATNTEMAAAKSGMDTARSTLAAAEAEATLHGAGADKQARRAYGAARDEHEFLLARKEGLLARRKAAVDAVVQARQHLAISYRKWEREQVQHFLEHIYLPAMDQFVPAIRMAAGVGAALHSNMLTAIGRDTVLRNPEDWERNPASARRTGWQTDPLYVHLAELAGLVRPHLGEEFIDKTSEDRGAAA